MKHSYLRMIHTSEKRLWFFNDVLSDFSKILLVKIFSFPFRIVLCVCVYCFSRNESSVSLSTSIASARREKELHNMNYSYAFYDNFRNMTSCECPFFPIFRFGSLIRSNVDWTTLYICRVWKENGENRVYFSATQVGRLCIGLTAWEAIKASPNCMWGIINMENSEGTDLKPQWVE